MTKQRLYKREFIKRVASRLGVSVRETQEFYDAMIEELSDTLVNGNSLTLTGFGRFYLSKHAFHKAHYMKDDREYDDYYTLHFSATRGMSKKLGERVEKKK